MNVFRVVVNCFAVIVFALVGTAYSMDKGENLTSVNPAVKLPISSLNGVPYGRIIATHAAGDYLKNRDVTKWGVIAGQAGTSALSRTTSAIIAQQEKNKDLNYALQTKQTVLHFGVDGFLRVMEAYAAYYGFSSKNIVKKSKEYLPESVADGVEIVAPVVGEMMHACASETLTNVVAHKAGCDK